jgi:hypothetical protein
MNERGLGRRRSWLNWRHIWPEWPRKSMKNLARISGVRSGVEHRTSRIRTQSANHRTEMFSFLNTELLEVTYSVVDRYQCFGGICCLLLHRTKFLFEARNSYRSMFLSGKCCRNCQKEKLIRVVGACAVRVCCRWHTCHETVRAHKADPRRTQPHLSLRWTASRCFCDCIINIYVTYVQGAEENIWVWLHGAESFLRSWHLLSYSKIYSILWNPKVYFCIRESPTVVPTLCQINPVHSLHFYPTFLIKKWLMRSVYPHYWVLNAWTNLYETWY